MYSFVYLVNYAAEGVAFAIMANDAKNKRAQQISTQTMVGLTISLILTLFNMPRKFEMQVLKASTSLVGTVFGFVACKEVARTTQVLKGEDDFTFPGLPDRTRKAMIYVATVISGCIALFIACKGSVVDTFTFITTDMQSTMCTFQNFLNAFSLVPQLLVCRRQGFVSPTAVRFLCIIGVKHLYEFFSDAWVSYKHYEKGKLALHELSFMLGDFIAAIVLLDFLFLLLMEAKKVSICTGEMELQLTDEEAGSREQSEEKDPECMSEQERKKLVVCAAMVSLALAGVALQLINVWAVAGAGLLFAAGRKVFSAPLLPTAKVEKCVV